FWLIAGPMIVGNVSLALLGLVDTAVIGAKQSDRYFMSPLAFRFCNFCNLCLRLQKFGIGSSDELSSRVLDS
ncbi:MAG: MATE family efflux transporter DinF, partial [Pseudomonadota bacterium]